ncbi:MAG: hypothetical protein AAF488_07235 [Planctomycetota bacterium]
MSCLLALFALLAPRTVVFLVWLFSDYLGQAYETTIWPLLGFFIMPLTTLAYAWAIHSRGEISGFPFFIVVLAVLVDLGLLGGSSRYRGGSSDTD